MKNIYGDGQGPLASFVKTMAAINSYRDRGWFQSHKNADDLGMVYEIRKKMVNPTLESIIMYPCFSILVALFMDIYPYDLPISAQNLAGRNQEMCPNDNLRNHRSNMYKNIQIQTNQFTSSPGVK